MCSNVLQWMTMLDVVLLRAAKEAVMWFGVRRSVLRCVCCSPLAQKNTVQSSRLPVRSLLNA